MDNRVALIIADSLTNLNLLEELTNNNYTYLIVYNGEMNEVVENYVKLGLCITCNGGVGAKIREGINQIEKKYPSNTLITIVNFNDNIKDIIRVTNECMINKDSIVLGNNSDSFIFSKAVSKLVSGKVINNINTHLRAFSYNYIMFLKTIKGEKEDYLSNMVFEATKKQIKIKEIDLIEKDDHVVEKDNNINLKDIDITKYGVMYFKYILDCLIFMVLSIFTKEHFIITNIFSRIISNLVFFKKERTRNIDFNSLINKYVYITFILLFVDIIILAVFVNIAHIPIILAKIITEIVSVLIDFELKNYFFNKL